MILQSTEFDGYAATKIALDHGYRHIDTAYFYANEKEIGKAINDGKFFCLITIKKSNNRNCSVIASGKLKREDIFVTTKLWCIHHDPKHVEIAIRKSLENFGLEYVDLYLIHTPIGYEFREPEDLLPKNEEGKLSFSDVDYLDTWHAMEKLVDLGLTKSIGVSNFNSEQITRVLENCRIKPVTNQVECSATLNQKKLTAFCKERGIVITAYSPLTRPHSFAADPSLPKPPLADDRVKEIGLRYNKSPAQVVLRYLIQLGVVPIPKSSNENRIKENMNIFDFELNAEEVAVMDSFHTGQRSVPFSLCTEHKYFMFNIEF